MAKGWGKTKKRIKQKVSARSIAKRIKPRRLFSTSITSIKVRDIRRAVAAPDSPLVSLFAQVRDRYRKGVANSIWNVIRASSKGAAYWMDIIKEQIAKYGANRIADDWATEYFHSSYNYEDSKAVEFITDQVKGESQLRMWEDEIMTDAFNRYKENADGDDPIKSQPDAFNVEDAIMLSIKAHGLSFTEKQIAEQRKNFDLNYNIFAEEFGPTKGREMAWETFNQYLEFEKKLQSGWKAPEPTQEQIERWKKEGLL